MKKLIQLLILFAGVCEEVAASFAVRGHCVTVEDVVLSGSESKKIFQSNNLDDTGFTTSTDPHAIYRCWRVLPSGGGAINQVVRVTVDNLESTLCPHNDTVQQRYGLWVFDGPTIEVNNTLAARCNSDSTAPMDRESFYSTQPYVFIKWVDLKGERGADITVSLQQISDSLQGCTQYTWNSPTALVISNSDYLRSSNYESNAYDCWSIRNTGSSSTLFQLKFPERLHFNAPTDRTCYDKLDIYSYDTSEMRLLHRICNYDYEGRAIYSSAENLYFRFTSDSRNENKPFKLEVTTIAKSQQFPSGCTPVVMSPSSVPVTITSPNYPEQYANKLDLCWSVSLDGTAQHSDQYEIDVYNVGMSLEPTWNPCESYNTANVTYDRLDIIPESGDVVSFCGGSRKESNRRFNTSFNIRFRTDSALTSIGFKLLLMSEPKDCKEMILWPGHQAIVLDKGRNELADDVEICRKITTPTEIQHIWLSDRISSEGRVVVNVTGLTLDPLTDCLTNYVKIYDGAGNKLLKQYCPGDELDKNEILSESDEIKIKMRSEVRSKYNITVQVLHDSTVEILEYLQSYTWRSYCDSTTFAKNDSKWRKDLDMYLFGYRRGFDYLGKCETVSVRGASPGDRLQLRVNWERTSFGPPADNCRDRYVIVYDGPSMDSPVLTYICWEKVDVITASGPVMTFLAVAKNEEHFVADFTVLEMRRYPEQGCIEIPINDTSVNYYISSPNYPATYTNNQDICWIAYLLTPNASARIKFDVTRFHDDYYEKYTACNDGDKLVISDDQETLSSSTFCDRDEGYANIPNVKYEKYCEERQYVKVRFTSDGVNATNGFYGYFKVASKVLVCDPYGFESDGDGGDGSGDSKHSVLEIVFGCITGVVFLGVIVYFARMKYKCHVSSRPSNSQSTAATPDAAPTEQEQIAGVSAPPSYNHVVEHNNQYPVTLRAGDGNAPNGASYHAPRDAENVDPPTYVDANRGAVNPVHSRPSPQQPAEGVRPGMSTVL